MYNPNYWSHYDAVWWAKWVYKYDWRPYRRECEFECFYDTNCDFFVDAHTHCFYGRFSYTGSQLGGWTDRTYMYVKNGKFSSLSFYWSRYPHIINKLQDIHQLQLLYHPILLLIMVIKTMGILILSTGLMVFGVTIQMCQLKKCAHFDALWTQWSTVLIIFGDMAIVN